MMDTTLFSPLSQLLSGLFVGICFGFLLRKAYVTRFPIIVGQLSLKDFTVMKVMLTAIAFGALGMLSIHYVFPDKSPLIISTTTLAALSGGGIFGIGMAILGFCPGTALGALTDGARDVIFGILGIFVGAALFAETPLWITDWIKPDDMVIKTTLPQVTSVPAWIFVALLITAVFGLILIDRKTLRNSP